MRAASAVPKRGKIATVEHDRLIFKIRNPCPNDLTTPLRALVADTNVNNNTFLETDYLNHFNEIVMLVVSDMPDILEDAKE